MVRTILILLLLVVIVPFASASEEVDANQDPGAATQIPLPHVTFGNSNNLTASEPVATVGYAERIREIPRLNLYPTVFGGRIRAVQSNGIAYCSVCPDFWTTDVGNNAGNSGALLLNRQGEVVGVDVAIVSRSNEAETLGFAIPSNTAVRIAAELISNG